MTEDHWDRDLFRTMRARAEQNAAERDRALMAMKGLVDAYPELSSAFSTKTQQNALNIVLALLAEHGGG
jgi:hypothetical protein